MWAKLTGRTFEALDDAKTVEAAFDVLVDYTVSLNADLVSYHHLSPPFAPNSHEIILLAKGFPDSWVAHYRKKSLHLIDPITSFSAYQTRPVLWSEIPNRITLTPEQQDYMGDLYAWLAPGDGMAVPAFGPSGRHGYFGIGRTTPIEPWSAAKIHTVQAVCEAVHLRMCEILLAGLPMDFELTERQIILLRAMANSTPDAIIGGMVNIRPDALASAIARLLRVMHVTDRPSAILRAKALGVVD